MADQHTCNGLPSTNNAVRREWPQKLGQNMLIKTDIANCLSDLYVEATSFSWCILVPLLVHDNRMAKTFFLSFPWIVFLSNIGTRFISWFPQASSSSGLNFGSRLTKCLANVRCSKRNGEFLGINVFDEAS